MNRTFRLLGLLLGPLLAGCGAEPQVESFDDGSVSRTFEVVHGLLHGPEQRFHAGGQLERSGSWVAGRRDGAWRFWSSAGQLLRQETWVRGARQGPHAGWDDAGALEFSGQWVNGLRHGEWWIRGGAGGGAKLLSYDQGELVGQRPTALVPRVEGGPE